MTDLPKAPEDRPAEPRALRRSLRHRIVAGVCGGIAEYLGVDPVVIRIAFVVLAFAGGGGVLLYVIGWILMPEQEAGSENRVSTAPVTGFDAARLVFGGVLIAVGAILLLNLAIPRFGKYFWPLALIAIGVAIIVQASAAKR